MLRTRQFDGVKTGAQTHLMEPEPLGSQAILRGPARSALIDAARAELAERGSGAISLRATARRAGVSHAAPKYHFGDRAGLLTAMAAEGFLMLAAQLRSAELSAGSNDVRSIGALGSAYVDFGVANPALFDLMYRQRELHWTDPALRAAQDEAMQILISALDDGNSREGTPLLPLMGWALAHGLAVFASEGALHQAPGVHTPADALDRSHAVAELFAQLISQLRPNSEESRMPPRE